MDLIAPWKLKSLVALKVIALVLVIVAVIWVL